MQDIKRWKAVFLRESEIRTYLQAFYVSLIGSSENARLLIENEPGSIDRNAISGNELVRSCFAYSMIWLELAREFSVSQETFTSQFLQPANLTAAFRLAVRSTVSLEGFVFSKSADFHDPYFGGRVVTMAMIVPELQTAMSIRCRTDQLSGDTIGGVILRNVQPMPYVNRIHHLGMQIERTKIRPDLSSLHFLKVNIDDAQRFHSSMAFENFCEIYSTRFGRRHLGAPYVLTGRLVWMRLPRLVIQSPVSGESVTLQASDNMFSNSGMDPGETESLQGQIIRMLAVIWYGKASKGAELQPEVFAIQRTDDENQASIDNLMGFVRLRGRVPLVKLHEMFPKIDLSAEIPCISVDENEAFWQHGRAETGSVFDRLHETNENIRRLRLQSVFGEGTLLAERRNIINERKLHEDWLVNRLSVNKRLLETLLTLIKYRDNYGLLPRRRKALCRLVSSDNPDSILHDILWMRGIGFIARQQDNADIRKQAISIAYRAIRPQLINMLNHIQNERYVVGFHELEDMNGYPPSLIIQALRELENSGNVQPLHRDGRRCELVWIMKGSDHEGADYSREAIKVLESLENQVLSVLGEFYHPLHHSKVHDMLRMRGVPLSHFTLMQVLSELREDGWLIQDREMWMYPWDRRVVDLLNSRPQDPFTLDELLRQTSVPGSETTKMRDILSSLEKQGDIWQPVNGFWCLTPKDERTRDLILQRIVKLDCEKFITTILKEHGGRVQESWLTSVLRIFIIKRIGELRLPLNWQDLSPEKIVADMLSRHILVKHNSTLTSNDG